jgi:hypothetical protein
MHAFNGEKVGSNWSNLIGAGKSEIAMNRGKQSSSHFLVFVVEIRNRIRKVHFFGIDHGGYLERSPERLFRH